MGDIKDRFPLKEDLKKNYNKTRRILFMVILDKSKIIHFYNFPYLQYMGLNNTNQPTVFPEKLHFRNKRVITRILKIYASKISGFHKLKLVT